VVLLAASIGIWLFYMQHQLEHAYWASAPNWEFHEAALKGSSFYDLPVVLHWLTGYIGFHHIHHICTNIPELSLAGLLQPQPRVPRCQAPHLS
jgi:omega-6 fatty acid desaturase (delta-12 desaturase)